jgi:hypothetical protein
MIDTRRLPGVVQADPIPELLRTAEEELRRRRPAAVLTQDDNRAMIESLGDLVVVLGAAEPARKAALYESLGLAFK